MYDRILVAVDGSDACATALAHAIRLAADQHAKLRLIHVVDELGIDLGPTPTPDAFWAAARRAGERILADASARAAAAGVDAETKLVEIRSLGAVIRRVADVLAEEATRWPADLTVIGTHGRRGVRKLLLGSVAEGLVRRSSLPVLFIRASDNQDAAGDARTT